MSEPWYNQGQKEHAKLLALCRLRGFPPWPCEVVEPKSRDDLQLGGAFTSFSLPARIEARPTALGCHLRKTLID